jgi:rod shape-determining protein MreC
VALAIVLLFLPAAYQATIAGAVRATVLRPVLALQRGAVERNARFADPARLRAERDSLAAYLVGEAALFEENRQLRELLGLRGRLPPGFVSAEVVRIPGRGVQGLFQLTAGQAAGIRSGAPIVTPSGLVGRVRTVDDRTSFGIDWMHPQFRASAMTLEGDIYGIVEPRRGPGGEPLLALTGTPRHADLEEGALIVTSGHGGVYPRGIPIGRVVGRESGGASWQRSYLVQPLVSPSEMAYVLVLGGPREFTGRQNLAAVWGIRPAAPAPVDTSAVVEPPPSAASPTPETEPAPEPAEQGPELLGVPVGGEEE